MTAYLIIQGTISDRTNWAAYRDAVLPLIVRFGGKHLTKGGGVERLEGGRDDWIIALFEFASMEAIHDFWSSPDYAPLKGLRESAAVLEVHAAPGRVLITDR